MESLSKNTKESEGGLGVKEMGTDPLIVSSGVDVTNTLKTPETDQPSAFVDNKKQPQNQIFTLQDDSNDIQSSKEDVQEHFQPHKHHQRTSSPPQTPSGQITPEPHHEWVSMDVDKFGKSFYNGDSSPLNEQIRSLKLKTLNEYLNNDMVDEIIEYSRSTDGLISNDLRRKIWPILFRTNNCPKQENSVLFCSHANSFLHDLNVADLPPHSDEDQVQLDIKRSFTILNHLQTFTTSFTTIYSKDEIQLLKKHLYNLIVKMLRKYPSLHYYQGYHDIASIILVICYDPSTNTIDEALAFSLLETLTLNHLRDFMISDINLSLVHLRLIPGLLEIVDHSFFKVIKHLSNGFVNSNGSYYDYSFYQGLSSILTMFSHDIDNLNQLLTVWDFSFSYNTVLINVYIYVAALVFKKDSIFKELAIVNEPFDVDRDLLHNLVSPASLFNDLTDSDLIKILNSAKTLFESYPVTKLSNSSYTFGVWFGRFNLSSVLMNTSSTPSTRSSLTSTNVNGPGLSLSDTLNEALPPPLAPSDLKDLSDEVTPMIPLPASSVQPPVVPDLVDDPESLSELLNSQDAEISRLVSFDTSNERSVFEDLEESTEYDTSSPPNSLSSSLSSLQSSTSNLNSKILRTSSLYFKKMFVDSGEGNNKPRSSFFKLTTIYKISLTVGFLGVLLHFLLTRHQNVLFNLNMFKVSVNNLFNVGIRGRFNL